MNDFNRSVPSTIPNRSPGEWPGNARVEARFKRRDMRKIRVAFVNTHPIQYFAPLYAYLNQTDDFSITAIYLSDYSIRGSKDHGFGQDVKWDIDLLEGYEPCFLPGAEARGEVKGYFSIVAPDLWSAIQSGDFDAGRDSRPHAGGDAGRNCRL